LLYFIGKNGPFLNSLVNNPVKLNIRVRINNRQDITVFDQIKDLAAKQKQVTLLLDFAGIGKGKHNIIIDVKDLFTRKTASEIIQINMDN